VHRGEVIVCPVCLAAILAATATSGGGLWALARVVKEDHNGRNYGKGHFWKSFVGSGSAARSGQHS
jgi:hypothetical protein